jgi:bifunctional UDP-N-acetylglucosamine pyrophosphorylase/glucosamine-1-phosphate N-acetyltransferase
MKSELPKVLHPVCGRPMLLHVLAAADAIGADRTVVVLGHGYEQVVRCLPHGCLVALQAQQLGTGHALLAAAGSIPPGPVLVLSGDTPLITGDVLQALMSEYASSDAVATVLTMDLADPSGYGRVVRDVDGSVLRIVEHRDANAEELAIHEVNAGLYVLPAPLTFEILAQAGADNDQGEIYLTDAIAGLRQRGKKVTAAKVGDPRLVLGVNSQSELAQAEVLMNARSEREKQTRGRHR